MRAWPNLAIADLHMYGLTNREPEVGISSDMLSTEN